MTLYASRAAADAAADRLRIYAQPQRLMILSRLIDGEHTVAEIEAATGIGQPALSQQLAELRRAAIVTTRRASRRIHYRLADDNVAVCVRGIEAMFGGAPNPADALATALTGPALRRDNPAPPGAASFARLD